MEIRAGYKKADIGIIPSDWEVKTLGDVGEVKMCRRVFNHETSSEGTIPFYKIGTFGKEADAYISEDLYNSYRQRFSFPKVGNILISAAGTIGRTLIYDGKPAYFQDSNIVWIDNKETLISNNFLYHVFQIVKYNTEGGTIQRLYNSILKSTKFLCPPTKAEQTAIATALNDTDALITQLEKLIAKKRAIKQGAMQELLKPKEGWEVKSIGEISVVGRGRVISHKEISKAIEGKYPVYSSQTLSNGVMGYLDSYDFEGEYLTWTTDGVYAGKVYYRNGRFNCTNVCGTINLKKDYAPFVAYLLDTITPVHVSRNLANPKLMNAPMKRIKIPLPNYEEQIRIAQILSDMDAELVFLEKKLDKYKMLKQGMMQNLLTGKIRLI
ncbi:MAG: restriction endonuclease subunit S [Deltaproteobacteria bacterium]